jgi:signal transduction histidine kinase
MEEVAAPPDKAALEDASFHPLEIIPFFRRWPRSALRDVIYTFIWSGFFGLGFYFAASVGSGKLPSLRSLGYYLLIANVVGYVIHGLFVAGEALKLEAAARRASFAVKVAYFAGVPMAGVVLGYVAASLLIDRRLLDWASRPGLVVSMLFTSLLISLVLSVIFFWRERSALAEAGIARERARAERVEREAALANLRALQAQIEPHFLFNTLANVAGLLDADPPKAKHMLESFIRFLRASLAATRAQSTTLGDEAGLIAAYLDVLQVRMGSRLRYAIDVPPELGAQPLPPMLLQPLVENAIRHGLEPKVEGGEVRVRARREGAHVVLEVTDSGVGFAPATRGGVGLTNLRERLKAIYEGRARLHIGENAPAGALVRLTIPA